MKLLSLLYCILFISVAAKAQPSPYTGGDGSGYQLSASPALTCAQFFGGIAAGNASHLSALTVCPSFSGGIADGSDSHVSAATPCPQFFGGIADGYFSNASAQTICPLYFGGDKDGYASDTSSHCLAVLPLKLLLFSGEKEPERNILHWKIEAGYNVQNFDIEKSANGVDFVKAGTVAGSPDPGHYYLFIDNIPYADITFYRLRILERDNTISYSKIIVIKSAAGASLKVYPNPVRTVATVSYTALKNAVSIISLYTINGKVVNNQVLAFTKGINIFALDMKNLPDGIYMLKVTDMPGVKIILQKE